MENFSLQIFIYAVIIFSAVIHEYSHGFIANYLGDPTAKDEGRLTLNPVKHIDPLGTVILPLFLMAASGIFIGWAKPVPYNPLNLRDKKYGSLKVALAGPGSNLIIALIIGLILRFSYFFNFEAAFILALGLIVYINIFLALFNLLPIAPLDGSKVLADLMPQFKYLLYQTGFIGVIIALLIAFTILSPLANFIYFLITGYRFN